MNKVEDGMSKVHEGITSLSETRSVMVMGERITFRAQGENTQGAMSACEVVTPPGGGAPPHIHSREDEAFYVVEGHFEFTVGANTIQAPAGSFLYGPRHVPHYYKNIGTQPAKMLVMFMPAGVEEAFADMSKLPQDGPPDFQAMAAILHKYGVEIALPPGV